jgi:hypothetical protein
MTYAPTLNLVRCYGCLITFQNFDKFLKHEGHSDLGAEGTFFECGRANCEATFLDKSELEEHIESEKEMKMKELHEIKIIQKNEAMNEIIK